MELGPAPVAPDRSFRWRPSSRLHGKVSGWVVLASIAVGAFVVLPLLYLIFRALQAGDDVFALLLRQATLATLGRTILLAFTVTVSAIGVALPVAWLTSSTDLPGRRFWTISLALPLVLPSYVVAFLLASTLGPRGLLQRLLEPLTGVERFPSLYGFPGAFFVLTIMTYPLIFLTVRAAFLRMDETMVESARSLGLNQWQAFWRITVPQLRPAIVAGSLLVALYVLRDFGAVSMLRYNTFTRMIYLQYQSFMSRSAAAVLALVLVLLTAIVLLAEQRSRGRARYYLRSGGGRHARRNMVALGRWRWPALVGLSLLLTVALIAPAGSLVYWLARNRDPLQSLSNVIREAGNSVGVSLAAALLAVLASIPVAVTAVRRGGRLGNLVERLSYTGYALPGIVVALSLVFFGANLLPALYQTTAMLLAGYLVIFIPQAVGSTRASLLQVPQGLEEAGRSLGLGPMPIFRRITLPLLRPGILAGGALVFLTAMKELPTTLLLSPAGFRTLSTSVWTNINEAFFAEAAVPALMLILLSSVPLLLLTFRDN